MDTVTLLRLLRKIRKQFVYNKNLSKPGGIFAAVIACDELDNYKNKILKSKMSLLIINHDTLSEIGSHWTSLFLWKGQNDEGTDVGTELKAEYFDPLGKSPKKNAYIWEFLKANVNRKNLIINKQKIQSNSSKYCGLFALVHLFLKLSGKNLEEILTIYCIKNLQQNDTIVKCLLESIVKISKNISKQINGFRPNSFNSFDKAKKIIGNCQTCVSFNENKKKK